MMAAYLCCATSYKGGKANTISFIPFIGKITVWRFIQDNSSAIHLLVLLQYRYVIITGGILAAVRLAGCVLCAGMKCIADLFNRCTIFYVRALPDFKYF
jgi:hypothetical protein